MQTATMMFLASVLLLQLASGSLHTPVRRQESTAAVTSTSVTAVSDCHLHDTSVFCMVGATEYVVDTTATATSDLPAEYTGCHNHGSSTYCLDADGEDVQITLADDESEEDSSEDSGDADEDPDEENCHWHAGVEHCVGGDDEDSEASCERVDRDYNVNLRIGMLFVVLATSTVGVFSPILISSFAPFKMTLVTILLKQFGTGVIISTAFVHLFTHANLMFENDCLGGLAYEATTAAIFMAGLFLSFLVEFIAERILQWQTSKVITESSASATPKTAVSVELLNVSVLEAGIVFHSLLIGLTLIVAGDSYFITLAIVIIFHQMFEGIALGTRIAALGTGQPLQTTFHGHSHGSPISSPDSSTGAPINASAPVSLAKKCFMAACFALVTPVGMAIGIGVLNVFNGNDPSTIIAIGTLDALSAGILAWVGIVEMWAHDWMGGGEMTRASLFEMGTGMFGWLGGVVLMSVLGKWA